MTAIRNFCVARDNLNDTSYTVVYTVPTGNNFILKAVSLVSFATVATTGHVLARQVSPDVTVELANASIPAGGAQTWNVWQVLNGGDALLLKIDAGSGRYWISGALLPFG